MTDALLLAIDTATRRAALALGGTSSVVVAERSWVAGYRHGEELLATLERLLAEAGRGLSALDGVVVGTGPGAFTGLRVGLATAKALAYGLDRPIVGVASTAALAEAAWAAEGRPVAAELMVAMPAGPHDRYLAAYRRDPGADGPVAVGGARLSAGREAIDVGTASLVAVDLPAEPGTSEAAVRRGHAAQVGLGRALLGLGAARLDRGDVDDVASLVPAYVTLPRGIVEQIGEIAWSRDLR